MGQLKSILRMDSGVGWTGLIRLAQSRYVRIIRPTIRLVRGAENFTVSIATAGQDGWGCPNPNALPYCSDDALRFGEGKSYVTFESFMNYARELKPIFLIIHQFNEFGPPDEGFDANTHDDIEPSNLWKYGALVTVRREIKKVSAGGWSWIISVRVSGYSDAKTRTEDGIFYRSVGKRCATQTQSRPAATHSRLPYSSTLL